MNGRRFGVGAASIALFLALPLALSATAQEQESPDSGGGGLVPLTPDDLGGVGAGGGARQDTLDRDQIAALLTTTDLAQREVHFETIVERARRDPELRHALSDLTKPGSDRELAWTALLALRLADERGLVDAGAGGDPLLPFSVDPFRDLRALLATPGLPGLGPDPVQGLLSGKANDGSSKVQLRQDDKGCVLHIEEKDANGDTKTREYRGESLQAILQANPGLKDEIGIEAGDGPGNLSLRFQPFRGSDVDPLERFFGGADPLAPFRDSQDSSLRSFLFPLSPTRPVRSDVLGVRAAPVKPDMAAARGIEADVGLYVGSVVPGTIAHLLEVTPGSILLTLNGRALKSVDDVAAVLKARKATESLTLEWIDAQGERHVRTWSPPRQDDGAAPKPTAGRSF